MLICIVFAEILHAIQTLLVHGLVLNYFWSLRDNAKF